MQNFNYRHCQDTDVVYLSDLNCDELVSEFSVLSNKLSAPDETGTARDGEGKSLKENKGVWLADVYSPEYSFVSPACRIFEEIFKEMKNHSFPAKSAMNYFKSSSGFNVLVSKYEQGNYYKQHRDTACLTMLVWPMPKNFEGGSLVLTDFNNKISCEQNTGLIFPSHYLHEVEEVICNDENSTRVTYTGFVS